MTTQGLFQKMPHAPCLPIEAAAMLLALVASGTAFGAADTANLEDQAFRAAAAHVAPSVVRIETLGGLERVGKVLAGTGPTTGLVVGEDGYIVSSEFNFRHHPASILVRLPDGTRKPAQLVATDRSRMIVLLKIEVDQPLPVPEFAPKDELRVGQWTVALGRAFQGDAPNMAIGILSACNRVWGKAVQTDAAVSPNNYGGPLVDIRGRVIGVLAPLSPQGNDEEAGYEWYDSGIGFAVHADQILHALPRLKAGEDLDPGLLGLSFRGANPAVTETVVAACHPNSSAKKAGIKIGDRIVAIDGQPVERTAQLKEGLARFYAGDTVKLTIARGKERFEREVELAAKLLPYEHPFLGILPMRDLRPDGGVAVRFVYTESPAAQAGIEPGDVLTALAGEPITDADALRESLSQYGPGEKVTVTVLHAGKSRDVQLALGRLPEAVPKDPLPSAYAKAEPAGEAVLPRVRVPVKIPEFPNDAWAYVPGGNPPKTPYGLVVWLHEPGGSAWEELLARWKTDCDRDGWILLAPESADPRQWNRTELPLIRKLIDQISTEYAIDPARIVLAGRGAGGAMALLAASHNRDVVRGIAVLDSRLPSAIAPNEPLERLAFYVARAAKSPHADSVQKAIEQLRAAKYPVTVKELGDQPRLLEPAERAELSRWVDCLDRL